jgi:hypothetical protein
MPFSSQGIKYRLFEKQAAANKRIDSIETIFVEI